MPEPIKSFEDLDAVLKSEQKENLKKAFEQALKGKFEKIPGADYKSRLPGVRSINMIPLVPPNGRPAIYASVFYESDDGAERHFTMNCFEDGAISGKLPKDLKFSRDELEREILYLLESLDVDIWHETKMPIIPDSDKGLDRQAGGGEIDEEVIEKPLTDPERIKFLDSQKGLLFAFFNRQNGFNGYKGWVFANFIILDTDKIGNAAFILDLKQAIPVDEEAFRRPTASRIDSGRRGEILNSVWTPIAETARTKGGLRALFGASKVVHRGQSWKERLQEEIDQRTKTEIHN
jgi:hypothetical protein